MKASRSPSPSRSAKSQPRQAPTSMPLNGLAPPSAARRPAPHRAGVLEDSSGCRRNPRPRVEVAVAVEIGEARHAVDAHVDAVERIGGAGLLREDRRGGGAGVPEIAAACRSGPRRPHQGRHRRRDRRSRRVEGPDVDAVERIGGAGLLRKGRGAGSAGCGRVERAVGSPTTGSRSPSPSRSAKVGCWSRGTRRR